MPPCTPEQPPAVFEFTYKPPAPPRRGQPFPRDAHLRAYGFTVLSRPKRGPTLWRKGRKVYAELDALAEADALAHWKYDGGCKGA